MKSNSGNHTLDQSSSGGRDDTLHIHDPLIGTYLDDHLEIISRVGLGGMSIVYKARDVLLNRMVAVKVLLPHVAFDPKGIRRFRQEALAVSKLDHPNIIRVYEFGLPADGQPYLVMDLIEGQSLEDFINRNGPIEPRRAITLITQVCLGLEVAHKHGVIHRDLKPGNIMLLKDESRRQVVKIVDFGLAKMIQDETDSSQGLTRTGDIFGSPLYMSPEQCLCESLDARSDIYSLACVMYEILTGMPPLKGKTVLDTIQMQIGTLPDPISRFHGSGLAQRLDPVLMKAMAKIPALRYQSIEDFRHALEDVKDSEKDEGLIGKLKYFLQVEQSKSQSGRRRWLVPIISGICTIAIVAVCIIMALNAVRAPNAVSTGSLQVEADWRSTNERVRLCFMDGRYDEAQSLIDKELKLAEALPQKRFEATSLANLIDLYYCLQKPVGSDTLARYEALNAPMFDTWEIQHGLLTAQNAADARTTIKAAIERTLAVRDANQSFQGEQLMPLALRVGARFLDPNDELLAKCHMAFAEIWALKEWNGNGEKDERKKAIAILETKRPTEELASTQSKLANWYSRSGDQKVTREWGTKALATYKQLEAPDLAEMARCEYVLAQGYANEDKDAADQYEKLMKEAMHTATSVSAKGIDDWRLLADLEVKTANYESNDPNKDKPNAMSAAQLKQNQINSREKVIKYLRNAVVAGSGDVHEFAPEIMRCYERIDDELKALKVPKLAIPYLTHLLATQVRVRCVVRDQVSAMRKLSERYADAKDYAKSAYFMNQCINAGGTDWDSSLVTSLIKLNNLKDALTCAKYDEARKRKKLALVLAKKQWDDSGDEYMSDGDGNVLPGGYEKLQLAHTLLIQADVQKKLGHVNEVPRLVTEAKQIQSEFTEKQLGDKNKYATLDLLQDSTKLEKMLSQK